MKIATFIFTLCLINTVTMAVEYEGEARKFILDEVFICPSTGYHFKVPDLEANTLRVQFAESVPGITWQIAFSEPYGRTCGVTYTKIRAEYPKTDEVLQKTASNIKAEVVKDRGFLEWCGFLSDEKGKVLQLVVRYPQAGQIYTTNNKWLKTRESRRFDLYEIRQYLVRDGFFIEYKFYIPQIGPPRIMNEDKWLGEWFDNLHRFVEGSSFVTEDDNYRNQIENFEAPESYFRFVYDNPSLD